jgi:diguanylate cyclase (GGDEF)-like protein/PAS domain S-box-containing protein
MRSTPPPSVRTLLLWLVFACVLPTLIGAGVLSCREYQDGRAQFQKSTIYTARAMVQTVDAELAKVRLLAQVLATSQSLARQDFAAFHRRALALLHASNLIQSVVIYDAQGQQLVNTRLPLGQPLPKRSNLFQVERVFASGKAVTTEVFFSPLTGLPVVGVAVPVFSGTKVIFALVIGIAPQQFNSMLSQQNFPPQWVVAVLDGAGTIVARTHLPEKFIGQKSVPALWHYLQQAPEGMHEMTTLEGIPILAAYSRSPASGWSVAIGISRQSLEAPLMRTLGWLGLGAALLLGSSLGLAWLMGGRITNSVRALRAHAIALGAGQLAVAGTKHFLEADEVAHSMDSAAHVLRQQTIALHASNATLTTREAELADAQRIAKVGSWSWDARTDTIVGSPELCQIFGMPTIPPFAQQDGVMFHHQAWLELNQAIEGVVRTGIGYNLELPALHAQSNRIWINARSEAVRNADGEVIGLHGMVQDITERKQAEDIAKSERFVRAVTDAMPGMVGYWDKELRCRFANQAYVTWFGKAPKDIIGGTMRQLMGAALFTLNEPHILAALAGERQRFERAMTKADGSIGYAMANYIPDIDDYGIVAGFYVLVTDITPFKEAEAKLKLADNVYQNTVDAVMVTDVDGIILSVNPAFNNITGYSAEEAIGQTPRLLRSNRHEQQFHSSLRSQISDTGKWQGEIWNRRKDGEDFLAWQTITLIAGLAGEARRYVSVFHDITEVWSKNESIKHLAFHDALTDLPNRALLMERLERHIALAKRNPRCMALMFLDLDRFKFVNDSLGHEVGDALLITVAQKLQALVRESDTVARLGGDEFVIMLDNPANREELVHISKRIIAAINAPMAFRGEMTQIGTSIGIAMYPADADSAAQLIKSADSAMYEAKNAGKNTFHFFDVKAIDEVQSASIAG